MENLIRYTPLLAYGALVTIALAVLSLALATLLGALGAAGRLGGGRVASGLVFGYTTIVRGVPDLVLLLLVYFGGQRLVNAAAGGFGMEPVSVSPFLAGVLSIGFIYGAYLTETFRGAYLTVPEGQIDAGLALATLLGALGAAGRLGGGRVASGLVFGYTTIVRGVPDLVLLLLVYFGGQRLVNAAAGGFGMEPVSVSPFLAGVLSIGFIYGAYLTETFRGAYLTVPEGQIDAGLALGLRRPALHWTVTVPQLVRFALPGYVNVWQVLVKSTAVVSVIGLEDLVGLADDAGKTAREPFVFFAAVLGVYLFITWASTTFFDWVEHRQGRGMRGAV